MAFPESSPKARIGQSSYWMWLGAYLLLTPVLLLGGIYMLASGSLGTGILLILGILPLGIWFRVVMMRRCRDIGWPAFPPWLFMGGSFVIGLLLPVHAGSGEAPGAGMLLLPALLGLGDFAFSIVIGCVGSKAEADYADIFGPSHTDTANGARAPAQPRIMPSGSAPRQATARHGESDMDRYDDAIARALEARQQRERLAAIGASPDVEMPLRGPGCGAATFGRRVA